MAKISPGSAAGATIAPPLGQPYALVYMPRGQPSDITERVRARVAGYLLAALKDAKLDTHDLVGYFYSEIGTRPAWNGGYQWDAWIRSCSNVELFHIITHFWRALSSASQYNIRAGGAAVVWVESVERSFREENVAYRVDSRGGVHPVVDVEFESQRIAAIGVLSGARYKATLEAFEGAHEAMERNQPDTKEAVRDVFSALENLFKLMTKGQASRLTKFEIDRHLPAMLDKHYKDATARKAAAKIMDSLSDWVGGTHNYRHEPGTPDPVPPPMDYAVMTMSTGAGFLRWLAEIDRALNP